MMTGSTPRVTLNNGVRMPQLGFGVFQVASEDVGAVVLTALECGYRSFDTASLYGNEEGVGAALRAARVPREELFVTTKLWNADHGSARTPPAFERSLSRLGLEYIDLYLIHWPVPSQDAYIDTWHAFERLYADERVRAIGVSNFTTEHLTRLLAGTSTVPAVNQIELHPDFQQAALREFHLASGIATEAWSPLGQGAALRDPTIESLARRYDKTPAQLILRWHLQLGNIVIPKSVTPDRIKENLEVLDFELTPRDMDAVSKLDRGNRIGPDPDVVGTKPSGFSTKVDPSL